MVEGGRIERATSVRADWRTTQAAAAMLAVALLIGRVPGLLAGSSAAWSAAVLVAMPPGLVLLTRLVRSGDRSAMVLSIYVAVTIVASLLSPEPIVALIGTFASNRSALLIAAAAAVWAIGRHVAGSGDIVARCAVAAAGLSGAIGLLQVWFTPGQGPLALIDGRPTGLGGNSVFFAAHMLVGAGYFAYVALLRPGWFGLAGFSAFAFLVGVSGVRIGALVLFALSIVVVARARTRFHLAYPLAAAVALGAANLAVAATGTGRSLGERAVSGGLSDRLAVWRAGVAGWIDRPLLGWGEWRFANATQAHLTDDLLARNLWSNAHNLFVETLVASGVVGLVALVAFLVLTVPRARGQFGWMSIGIGATLLFQPTPPSVLALGALFLGMAVPRRFDDSESSDSRMNRVSPAWVVLGLVLAASYLVSQYTVDRVRTDPAATDIPVSGFWFRADPDVALEIGFERWRHVTGGLATIDEAIVWSERAVRYDGSSAVNASIRSADLLRAGAEVEALAEAERALILQPGNLLALEVVQLVAIGPSDGPATEQARDLVCRLVPERCRWR